MEVVAAALAGRGVGVDAARREDPLPGPLAVGVRELAGEGIGERDVAGATLEIGQVLALDPREVLLERRGEAVGQDGDAVLSPLAVVDEDLLAGEVDVLDPQAAALEQAQAGAVHEGRHEGGRSAHLAQDRGHLLAGEDDGEAVGEAGAGDLLEPGELAAEDLAIEEEKRAEGLVLGGGADVPVRGEVAEVARDLRGAEAVGVALAVEEDEAADPGDVGLLGARAEVARVQNAADAVEQPRGRRAGGRRAVHVSPPTPGRRPAGARRVRRERGGSTTG